MDDQRVLDAFGEWVASLAPWTHFATLTYAPPVGHVVTTQTWTRVGMQHARRQLRDWFHRDVRIAVPTAVCWFETELHQSGQPHHHGLLALGDERPRPGLERRWAHGHAQVEVIDYSSFSVARYVEKAAIRPEARPPVIWGLPLRSLSRPIPLSARDGASL